jgi:Fe-S-cluster containining protein
VSVRIPLPMAAPPREVKACTECAKCCTYVSVGINPPRSVRYASDIVWYLYHQDVSVYRDGDGEWSVVFETRCRHLGEDRLCGVYAHRPEICREFDNTTCDVNQPEGGLSFEEPAQFLDWLRATRPRLHARLAERFLPPADAAAAAPPAELPERPEPRPRPLP